MNNPNFDQFHQSYQLAQAQFGGQIETGHTDLAAVTYGNGLDVLNDARANRDGFQPIEVDVRDYLRTPQILGRIVLYQNTQHLVMNPAVVMPDQHQPGLIRIAKLDQPFVPRVGLTDGIHFGVSVEAQTQAPGFGGHGQAGGFEAGHLGVSLSTARSPQLAHDLRTAGDKVSHRVMSGDGLPRQLGRLGMINGVPAANSRVINPSDYPAGYRLPLYWHQQLEAQSGAALADFDNTLELLLGAAVSTVGQRGLDQAAEHITNAIRGASR